MADKNRKELTLIQEACGVFNGPHGGWAWLGFLMGLAFLALFAYSLWRFWIAVDVTDHLHWGLAAILSALFLAMLKLWFWLMMLRNSIVRAMGK